MNKEITIDGIVYVPKEEAKKTTDWTKGMLLEYAKKTYKKGMNVISPYTGRKITIHSDKFKYNGGGITVWTNFNYSYIYTPGQGWAEIIKDEHIEIGEYEIKKEKGGISFGCEHFNTSELNVIVRLFNICKAEKIAIEIDNDDELKLTDKDNMCHYISYDKLFKDTLLEKF